MSDIDREIEKALSAEDQALAKQFEEFGVIGQVKSVFQGKTAWISMASLIVAAIATVLFFYAAWKFVVITEINEKVIWGGAAWFFLTMVAFMKVWFWMRMESNRIVREIKRVELQIVRLQVNKP